MKVDGYKIADAERAARSIALKTEITMLQAILNRIYLDPAVTSRDRALVQNAVDRWSNRARKELEKWT